MIRGCSDDADAASRPERFPLASAVDAAPRPARHSVTTAATQTTAYVRRTPTTEDDDDTPTGPVFLVLRNWIRGEEFPKSCSMAAAPARLKGQRTIVRRFSEAARGECCYVSGTPVRVVDLRDLFDSTTAATD
jgi:hypothetical protein